MRHQIEFYSLWSRNSMRRIHSMQFCSCGIRIFLFLFRKKWFRLIISIVCSVNYSVYGVLNEFYFMWGKIIEIKTPLIIMIICSFIYLLRWMAQLILWRIRKSAMHKSNFHSHRKMWERSFDWSSKTMKEICLFIYNTVNKYLHLKISKLIDRYIGRSEKLKIKT